MKRFFNTIFYFKKGLSCQIRWIIILKWKIISEQFICKLSLKVFKVVDLLYTK